VEGVNIANLTTISIMNTTELLDYAIQYAKAGGLHTLNYFRKSPQVIRKSDKSPVTIADREAEWVIRELIQKRFPGHGIIGEEHGRVNEHASVQWILDPIDGTVSFIHGIPLYTTLIGVLVDGIPVAGVIYAPAMDELCEGAPELGTRLNGVSARISNITDLSQATLLTTDRKNIRKYGYDQPVSELMKMVQVDRTWGDAYGHMMVATGRAHVMIDPILSIWDAAALLPVVQGAGGIFTDRNGVADVTSGNGISVVPGLHQTVLEQLKGVQHG
jgi:histidinol-phosphatase